MFDYRESDVNAQIKEGETPLHLANIYKGDTETVRLLIDSGADVNAQIKEGETPLHLANIYKGDTETVRLLIDRGAEIK